MKARMYFDTSIFGGVHDHEFEKETTKLFEMVENGFIRCLYSDLTIAELEYAPRKVKIYFEDIVKSNSEKLDITAECQELAQKYIKEKVVGETSFDDCMHIAIASVHSADVLISWNFKHIVNVFRIKGYNAINIKNGLPQLDIRSPKEIIEYDDKEE